MLVSRVFSETGFVLFITTNYIIGKETFLREYRTDEGRVVTMAGNNPSHASTCG